MPRQLLAAALIALVVGACGGPEPQLRMAGDSTVSLGLGNAAYDKPRSVGGMMLCLTSAATATITAVTPHEPSGDIRVEAFAVRPDPSTRGLHALGDDPRPLAQVGGGFDPGGVQQVSGICPASSPADDQAIARGRVELGVQVSWSSGDVSGFRGLDVSYQIGDHERKVFISVGVWLCARICPDNTGS